MTDKKIAVREKKPTAAQLVEANRQADRRRAVRALRDERDRLDGYKERTKRAQRRFDKTIAIAVSSRPRAEDWSFHPGPMTHDQVMTGAKLTSGQLVALMKRYQRS